MADATVSKTVGGNSMWVRLPPSAPSTSLLGEWLSLVERSVRDAEVGGSNPLAPTTEQKRGVMTQVVTPRFIYRAYAVARKVLHDRLFALLRAYPRGTEKIQRCAFSKRGL